MPTNPTTKMPA